MSALDQAFIKAFAKDPPAAASRKERAERVVGPAQPVGESAVFDELYDAGSFYRVDMAAEQSVPAPHAAEPKIPRRLQRRGVNRAEIEALDAPPPLPEPVVPVNPHSLPPRRQWSKSMLEIARQLARLDLTTTSISELPPEIVYIEPPLEQPVAPPPAPAEQNVAEAPAVELPPVSPQAIADLWSVDAVITQSSIVNFADAETWLAAPVAPAVVCNENIANGWSTSVDAPVAEKPIAEKLVPEKAVVEQQEIELAPEVSDAPNIEARFKATVVAHASASAAKSKKKFRVDSSHTRVPVPHTRPAVKIDDVAAVEESPVAEVVQDVPEVVAEPVAKAAETPAPTVPKRPYVPLWEVDRFNWPALCDKLMHDPNGYFASASNKLLSVVRGGLKVLGITGSRRGEGRTTLALCLARAAANAGVHVALVDADFARPQLATMLGLETAYGWQEAALGKIPLSEAAVKSLADRVTVLPLEVSTSTAKLSLADPRVTATLRATAATFELVIVDLGPLGPGNEPLFPAGENCPLDAAVVVRDVRYALVNESRAAGDRLYDAGIEAVGIAENFVTDPELAFL